MPFSLKILQGFVKKFSVDSTKLHYVLKTRFCCIRIRTKRVLLTILSLKIPLSFNAGQRLVK